jgi:hypothetical protein
LNFGGNLLFRWLSFFREMLTFLFYLGTLIGVLEFFYGFRFFGAFPRLLVFPELLR